jgi:D-beta-D-heptose 7-phosphate kinase/D-beta-D-heptose 1-phosphate adenosyltransferase
MLSVNDFARLRVLCVGDVMLDCLVMGTVSRIAPESPVPVLRTGKWEEFPGGAANVARNIAALGGRCTLVGIVGADEHARRLKGSLRRAAVHAVLVPAEDRPTTRKMRFLAQGQQILRVDDEETRPIAAAVADKVLEAIDRLIGSHDVLLLSDYAKGLLTDAILRNAIETARVRSKRVVVDPKSADLSRYHGATVITPNAREIELSTGIDVSQDYAAAAAAARALEVAACDGIVITRSEMGVTVMQRGGMALHIASRARQVVDVTGAGDTAIAVLALALGSGAGLVEAAHAANIAAGIAVGRRGTAAVSRSDLLAELGGPGRAAGASSGKVLNAAELVRRVRAWKREGLRVGFTNGCFDLLHVGHVRLLEFAKASCDRLVVAVNSDASVRRLKGSSRPVNSDIDRVEMLGALSMIDAVHVFGEDTPLKLIELLQPDVMVKGADYRVDEIVGAEVVQGMGGQVLRFDLVPNKSSTRMIEDAALKSGNGLSAGALR